MSRICVIIKSRDLDMWSDTDTDMIIFKIADTNIILFIEKMRERTWRFEIAVTDADMIIFEIADVDTNLLKTRTRVTLDLW